MLGYLVAAAAVAAVALYGDLGRRGQAPPTDAGGRKRRKPGPVFPVKGARRPTAEQHQFGYQRSDEHTHQGVDIFAPEGTPVLAPVAGTVVHAIDSYTPGFRGYGKTVVLRRERRSGVVYLLFAHLDSLAVSEGDQVEAGGELGTVGRTQYTEADPSGSFESGPHLHFEVSETPYPQDSEAPRLDPGRYLSP